MILKERFKHASSSERLKENVRGGAHCRLEDYCNDERDFGRLSNKCSRYC